MKRNRKMLHAGVVFLFVFLLLYLMANATRAQKEKKEGRELVMGFALHPLIPNTSLGGKGMADAREMFQSMSDEMKKLYGYTITLKIYPAPKFLFKAFQDKTLDCSFTPEISLYLYAKNHGIPVTPFVSISEAAENGVRHCIYARKGSGIKNVKDLKGKSFVSGFPYFLSKKDALPCEESYIDWVMVKKAFAQNGITTPFKEFFKEFKVLPAPAESVGYSVMLKKFDALMINPSFMQSLKNYDPGFSDLAPLPHSCVSIPGDTPAYCRNDADAQMVQQLKAYFLSPPKGSRFEKILKKEFKGLKPYAVSEKDYAIYFKWLKEAEQKGWLKEFDAIMKSVLKQGSK